MNQNFVKNSPQNRIIGIDLLKIFAMLLIIIGHLLTQYGAGANALTMSVQTYSIKFLGILSSCAVNCYAICTGYLMIEKKASYRRLFDLWFQIEFYSIGILILFYVLIYLGVIPQRISISATQLIVSTFPIIKNSWWYASAYFGLFLVIPFINNIILGCKKETIQKLLLCSFLIASISSILYGDGLSLKFGYSVTWLIIMYSIGAYIRLFDINIKSPLFKYGLCVLLCLGGAFLIDYLIVYRMTGLPKSSNILCLYTSPITIMESVFLFISFKNIQLKLNKSATKFIYSLSGATFGIYLIHTHDVVWDYFQNIIDFTSDDENAFVVISSTLIIAIMIFFICFILDWLRLQLFMMARIDSLSYKCFQRAEHIINVVNTMLFGKM